MAFERIDLASCSDPLPIAQHSLVIAPARKR